MNIFKGNSTAWKLSVMAAIVLQGLVPASAWEWNVHPDCELEDPVPGECDTSAVWWWAHDGVTDLSKPTITQVGVAENQSTSLGTPAIVYVAYPTSTTLPYSFEVRTQIGTENTLVDDFVNNSTETWSIISTPSLSVLPNGEAHVAWTEMRTTSVGKYFNVVRYAMNADGTWGPRIALLNTGVTGYRYEVGAFDVQIYDDENWAWGGNWWSQANSTARFIYKYRLKMCDSGMVRSLLPYTSNGVVVGEGDYSYEEDEPSLSGPVPFSYKMGTSITSSPSSLVYNEASSYGSTTGSPSGQQLRVLRIQSASPSRIVEKTLLTTYAPYFALVTTNANKRHVVYQHISTPPTPNWLYCATSSAVNSWSTHQPVTSGPWGYEALYGEPIAAVADPNASSDAFDVLCWAPASYDPNIATVLQHSSGTSYTIDNAITDTSSVLFRPGSKSIGIDGYGENTVSLYTSLHGNEVAVSYEVE